MPRVNPAILSWARETADLSLEEAAQAIGLKNARGRTGAERLYALEQGEGEPSRPLLRKMAKKYYRPLLIFYLDKPPRRGDRGKDFRTAPGAAPLQYSVTLDALIRDINARHSLVKKLLEDEETPLLSFVGSASMEQRTESIAAAIARGLGGWPVYAVSGRTFTG